MQTFTRVISVFSIGSSPTLNLHKVRETAPLHDWWNSMILGNQQSKLNDVEQFHHCSSEWRNMGLYSIMSAGCSWRQYDTDLLSFKQLQRKSMMNFECKLNATALMEMGGFTAPKVAIECYTFSERWDFVLSKYIVCYGSLLQNSDDTTRCSEYSIPCLIIGWLLVNTLRFKPR